MQTCDWPRNVGCDGLGEAAPATATASAAPSTANRAPESRSRYTPPPPPPPAQPSAVVTSRGQPRQLHHNKQEIIKVTLWKIENTKSELTEWFLFILMQQQELYADAVESLPLAEEVENDRQQRVYRGQPSTVGQVQRDRDGLRHTNAISVSICDHIILWH